MSEAKFWGDSLRFHVFAGYFLSRTISLKNENSTEFWSFLANDYKNIA